NAATPWVRTLGKAAVLFTAYFLGAYCAITLSRDMGRVVMIWPASALALGVLLRSPPRDWPAYLMAAVAANLPPGAVAHLNPAITAGFALLNLVEILLAAGLLHHLRTQVEWLASVRSLMKFLAVAAVLAPTAIA